MEKLGVLLLLPILISCAHGPADCIHFNVTVVADDNTPPFPLHNSVEYASSIVNSQYIVTFTNYYTTDARDGFISAALRPFCNWTILPRSNPSSQYPSDFSIVQLASASPQVLKALSQHPTIKRVTPQKMLTRLLTSGGGKGCGVVWCVVGVVCGGGEGSWQFPLMGWLYYECPDGDLSCQFGERCDWQSQWNSRYTPHMLFATNIDLNSFYRSQLSKSSLADSVRTGVSVAECTMFLFGNFSLAVIGTLAGAS